jgi:hypothetical protein
MNIRYRHIVPMVLLAALCITTAGRAQQRILSLDDVSTLVRGDVRTARIVQIASERCLNFRMDAYAEGVLRQAGGSSALIDGLRNVCQPRPVPPPPTLAAGTPVSTSAYDLPFLNARVSSVRFFESPLSTTPLAQRVYRYRFPQSSSRLIMWQVSLVYPPAGYRRDFRFEAVYYRPDGSELVRDTITTYSEASWPGSDHTKGRGWETSGNWPTGVYRVEFVAGGLRFASGSFEITPVGAPVNDVPAIDGKVTHVRFFESGDTAPASGQELFSYRFPRATTRYIYYRLDLTYPLRQTRVDFPITTVIYLRSGVQYDSFVTNTYVERGWSSSNHRNGRGLAQPGNWPVGSYRVEFFQGGQRIAVGAFDVY